MLLDLAVSPTCGRLRTTNMGHSLAMTWAPMSAASARLRLWLVSKASSATLLNTASNMAMAP
ncbi:hypothetical protein D3C71_2022140 [compost metagenome]